MTQVKPEKPANPVGTLSTWTYDKLGNVLSAKVYDTAIPLPADANGSPPVVSPR